MSSVILKENETLDSEVSSRRSARESIMRSLA